MEKRITQKELAALAHVCPSAVSAVLTPNNKGNTKVAPAVRERIIAIAKKYNYCPNYQARMLRGGKSGLVGVLTNAQISQFFYDILLPLEIELHKAHKRIIIAQLGNDIAENEEVLRGFVNYSLDGMIVLHHDIEDGVRLFSTYQVLLPQMVFLDPAPAELRTVRSVSIDYSTGVREAVRHLAAAGRRRIGLFMNDRVYRSMKMRFDGYLQGLADAGLAPDESLQHIVPLENRSLAELADMAAERLVAAGADAIIAGNDVWASALLKALFRRGVRVPDDIAIAGYGNTINICESSFPELTSIDHGVGEVAAKLVAALADKELRPAPVATRLVIRESTGAAAPVSNDCLLNHNNEVGKD